jgi:hypothetical protein
VKGKKIAWALVFLGLGLIIGAGFSRVLSQVGNRVTSTTVERFVFPEQFGGRIGRSIEITVPEIPTIPPIPTVPPVPQPPTVRVQPFGRGDLIFRDRITPFSIIGVIRSLISWVINVSALVLILVGVILIVRRSRQPVEKAPAKVITESD